MQWAIFERGGTDPVSTHDTEAEAVDAYAQLINDGVPADTIRIGRIHEHHAGAVFPGGVEIHLPK